MAELTPKQIQALQELKKDLKKYQEEVASGKFADLPISRRGMREYEARKKMAEKN
jgi:hypothetical protein